MRIKAIVCAATISAHRAHLQHVRSFHFVIDMFVDSWVTNLAISCHPSERGSQNAAEHGLHFLSDDNDSNNKMPTAPPKGLTGMIRFRN